MRIGFAIITSLLALLIIGVAHRDKLAAYPMVSRGMEGAQTIYSRARQKTAPDYITARAERGSLEQVVTVTGALQPVTTVEIGSQLAGEISKLFVDFNDEVVEGQPLAQMDQKTFLAKVDEARAALEMAKASLRVQKARLDRAKIDLDNARASRSVLLAKLENAEAQTSAAERDVLRKTMLSAKQAASTASVEEAQTQLASKTAALKETSSLLALHAYTVNGAEADLRRLEAELAQTQAELPLRQASLRVAEIELQRTVIRSPINGVVVGRMVNEGQTLQTGIEARTIFVVARTLSEMEIHARVDETDIGKIKPGDRASFTVDAYPDRKFAGVVRQVRKAAQVTQNVVTYTVVLITDNREGVLLPGMTALVRIIVNQEDDVLKVPLAALRFQPTGAQAAGGPALWVVGAEGQLRSVPVTVGVSGSDQVAVASPNLEDGDQIAVGQSNAPREKRLFGVRIGF